MSTSPARVVTLVIRSTLLENQRGSDDRVIAGISNPPLTGQQLRVEELVSGRALFCPGVEKSAPKAEESENDQRHKDVIGKWESNTLKTNLEFSLVLS